MKQGIWINKYVNNGHVESESFDSAFDAEVASRRGSSKFNLPYLKTMVFEVLYGDVNKYKYEIQY